MARDRWAHVYNCVKQDLTQIHSFSEFCFHCSSWITSAAGWDEHCQRHIDELDLPHRCDPVRFRHAISRAGYCPRCLGDQSISASKRMRQFADSNSWKRHISMCIQAYVSEFSQHSSVACPHPICSAAPASKDLWHHLSDYHSTHQPGIGMKRRRVDGDDEVKTDTIDDISINRRAKKPRRLIDTNLGQNKSTRLLSTTKRQSPAAVQKFINFSQLDFVKDVGMLSLAPSEITPFSRSGNVSIRDTTSPSAANTPLSSARSTPQQTSPWESDGCSSHATEPSDTTTPDPSDFERTTSTTVDIEPSIAIPPAFGEPKELDSISFLDLVDPALEIMTDSTFHEANIDAIDSKSYQFLEPSPSRPF